MVAKHPSSDFEKHMSKKGESPPFPDATTAFLPFLVESIK